MKTNTRFVTCVIVLCMFAISAFADVPEITETFETGLPTSATASNASVTLSSGLWVINNVYGKTDNGSVRAVMKTNGYLVSPAIDKPTTVTFNHRGSGSGKILTIEKSVNNGSWTTIGTVSVSSSSTYATSAFSINEKGSSNVCLRFVCASASIYIDNVNIYVSELPDDPTMQAAISADAVAGSSVNINFTTGDGDGHLLVYRKGTDVTWIPVDGTLYTAGTAADENHTIAYVGTASNVTISGLEAGETYYFAVFEYNGSGTNTNYLTASPGTTQVTTLQVPTISISPSSLNFGLVKVGNVEKREFTISAKYLTSTSGNISIVATSVFNVSLQLTSGYATSLTLPFTSDSLASAKIYVEFIPTEYKTYTDVITISGGGATTRQVTVAGTGSDTDAKIYYISPSGDDTHTGTFDYPLKNLQVAVDKMVPGDTVFVRGGIYYPDYKKDGAKTTIRLDSSGTAEKRLCIFNYPGETPILNFSDQQKAVSIRGVQLNGNYWHIRGIHITEAGDNGMKLEGNHNIIEKCTFSYNDDTGLQLGFGHDFSDSHPGISSNDGSYCAYNDVIDCDSYFNYDTDNRGSDADGFACKMHNGKCNRFIRCRAWDNSDDAWDLYETDYAVYLIECWAWGSGRESNFNVTGGSFQGNGNGIKMGGNGSGGSSKGKHEAWYCIAFNNNKTGSVKGFDQNSHGGGVKLVNCLAFGNGYDYMFETASGEREFYNNISFGSLEIASGAIQGKNAALSTSDEGWTNNVCSTFTTSDFNSLSEDYAKQPRGTDGSMPTTFARLVQGSVLIDLGDVISDTNSELDDMDLPWAYSGAAPDLGPYEYSAKSAIAPQIIINQKAVLNVSCFPNPVVDNGTLKFSVSEDVFVSMDIYNLQGIKVKQIVTQQAFHNIEYYIPFDISTLPNGIYLVVLKASGETAKCRFVVAR